MKEVVEPTETEVGYTKYTCQNCEYSYLSDYVTSGDGGYKDIEPEQPAEPETPDNPVEPGEPAEPENPDEPVTPDEPENPDEPDVPDEPETPEQPFYLV